MSVRRFLILCILVGQSVMGTKNNVIVKVNTHGILKLDVMMAAESVGAFRSREFLVSVSEAAAAPAPAAVTAPATLVENVQPPKPIVFLEEKLDLAWTKFSDFINGTNQWQAVTSITALIPLEPRHEANKPAIDDGIKMEQPSGRPESPKRGNSLHSSIKLLVALWEVNPSSHTRTLLTRRLATLPRYSHPTRHFNIVSHVELRYTLDTSSALPWVDYFISASIAMWNESVPYWILRLLLLISCGWFLLVKAPSRRNNPTIPPPMIRRLHHHQNNFEDLFGSHGIYHMAEYLTGYNCHVDKSDTCTTDTATVAANGGRTSIQETVDRRAITWNNTPNSNSNNETMTHRFDKAPSALVTDESRHQLRTPLVPIMGSIQEQHGVEEPHSLMINRASGFHPTSRTTQQKSRAEILVGVCDAVVDKPNDKIEVELGDHTEDKSTVGSDLLGNESVIESILSGDYAQHTGDDESLVIDNVPEDKSTSETFVFVGDISENNAKVATAYGDDKSTTESIQPDNPAKAFVTSPDVRRQGALHTLPAGLCAQNSVVVIGNANSRSNDVCETIDGPAQPSSHHGDESPVSSAHQLPHDGIPERQEIDIQQNALFEDSPVENSPAAENSTISKKHMAQGYDPDFAVSEAGNNSANARVDPSNNDMQTTSVLHTNETSRNTDKKKIVMGQGTELANPMVQRIMAPTEGSKLRPLHTSPTPQLPASNIQIQRSATLDSDSYVSTLPPDSDLESEENVNSQAENVPMSPLEDPSKPIVEKSPIHEEPKPSPRKRRRQSKIRGGLRNKHRELVKGKDNSATHTPLPSPPATNKSKRKRGRVFSPLDESSTSTSVEIMSVVVPPTRSKPRPFAASKLVPDFIPSRGLQSVARKFMEEPQPWIISSSDVANMPTHRKKIPKSIKLRRKR